MFGAWLAAGVGIAIGGCRSKDAAASVEVCAAASVADAVEVMGRSYSAATGVSVHVTRGASGILCRQIENGAPCNVFVPAHPRFIDRLARRNSLTVSNRRVVARNRLALIVRKGFSIETRGRVESPRDRIASVLKRAKRIVIANADHAPAGRYAQQMLDRLGLRESVSSRVAYGDDVRMTAQYVAQGAADCGIVYTTDAMAFRDQIGGMVIVPADLHEAIVYEACAIGDDPAGPAFVKYLASDKAAAIWRENGFESADAASGE